MRKFGNQTPTSYLKLSLVPERSQKHYTPKYAKNDQIRVKSNLYFRYPNTIIEVKIT